MVGFLLSDYQGRERGKGRVGEGGREENRMGGRGGTPVKWSVNFQGWTGGGRAVLLQVLDCLTCSQSSQVNMAASFHTLNHIVPTT